VATFIALTMRESQMKFGERKAEKTRIWVCRKRRRGRWRGGAARGAVLVGKPSFLARLAALIDQMEKPDDGWHGGIMKERVIYLRRPLWGGELSFNSRHAELVSASMD